MKKILILTIVGLVLIFGLLLLLFGDISPIVSPMECIKVGGKWKRFSNGCVDSCMLARQDPNDIAIACTTLSTYGCDCGPDRCWNGKTCESN